MYEVYACLTKETFYEKINTQQVIQSPADLNCSHRNHQIPRENPIARRLNLNKNVTLGILGRTEVPIDDFKEFIEHQESEFKETLGVYFREEFTDTGLSIGAGTLIFASAYFLLGLGESLLAAWSLAGTFAGGAVMLVGVGLGWVGIIMVGGAIVYTYRLLKASTNTIETRQTFNNLSDLPSLPLRTENPNSLSYIDAPIDKIIKALKQSLNVDRLKLE